ncbi:MAG TPA: hypothetical protein VJ852_07740 [Gemmatimonadaceae bacterium]|nr:hypothetical protein [Gemmatimonadaceae bacterium]
MRLIIAPILVAGIASMAHAQQKRVEYDISFPDPAQHEARVIATFAGVTPGRALNVRMSRSSPGRYAETFFAKNVYDVSATDGHGNAIAVTRRDTDSWDVVSDDGTVRVSYNVWGDRTDGTYLSIDHFHAHMNMPATFMWASDFERAPIRLAIHAPAGWRIATQLRPTGDSAVFTAPSLQYFMDSPTEVGPVSWRTWTASYGGKPSTWRLAVHFLGNQAQLDTFATMAQRIVAEEVAMWGEPAGYDYGTYTFIADYLPWGNSDGMEHRNSTIMTGRMQLDTRETVIAKLETVSHEFFHSWNMERLRSRQIEPFDFARANMSDALWFGEGFTQYYGELFMRRAGLYSDSEYVAQLGNEIAGAINSPARAHGSPMHMSRLAVFFDGGTYADPTNASNVFLSYYTWGDVIAAALDLILRERYQSSLDDFMRLLWVDYGRHQSLTFEPERPYTVADLRNELGKLTRDPAFANDFFHRYIEGNEIPDFASLVTAAGLVFAADSVIAPALRIAADSVGNGVLVLRAAQNGSAYAAGWSNGDIVVSLDGEAVRSPAALNAIVAKHRVGDVVAYEILQKGRLPFKGSITLKGIPTFQLKTLESVGKSPTAAMVAFRRSWLGSKVGNPR